MRSINNIKRIVGLLVTAALIVCLFAAAAVQCSAATLGDAALPPIGSGSIMLIALIFVIIFLLAAVVIVVFVITTGTKGNQGAPQKTGARQTPAAPVPPASNDLPPVQLPVNPMNNAPSDALPTEPIGAGETTVLGVSSPGTDFILKRKRGDEEIRINKSEFFLGKEMTKSDYCITNNNSISRRHAKIKVRNGKCYISDLGSTNCTYINGIKLLPDQEIALIPGDVIKLSNEEFEFIG